MFLRFNFNQIRSLGVLGFDPRLEAWSSSGKADLEHFYIVHGQAPSCFVQCSLLSPTVPEPYTPRPRTPRLYLVRWCDTQVDLVNDPGLLHYGVLTRLLEEVYFVLSKP